MDCNKAELRHSTMKRSSISIIPEQHNCIEIFLGSIENSDISSQPSGENTVHASSWVCNQTRYNARPSRFSHRDDRVTDRKGSNQKSVMSDSLEVKIYGKASLHHLNDLDTSHSTKVPINSSYISHMPFDSRGIKGCRLQLTETKPTNSCQPLDVAVDRLFTKQMSKRSPTQVLDHVNVKCRKKGRFDDRWGKRFVWPEDLRNSFTSAIFDIGLKLASPSMIVESLSRNERINTEEVKHYLEKYKVLKTRCHLDKPEAELSMKKSTTKDRQYVFEYEKRMRIGNRLTIMVPKLTEEGKKSPIGISLGYLFGLFFSLRQQLLAGRSSHVTKIDQTQVCSLRHELKCESIPPTALEDAEVICHEDRSIWQPPDTRVRHLTHRNDQRSSSCHSHEPEIQDISKASEFKKDCQEISDNELPLFNRRQVEKSETIQVKLPNACSTSVPSESNNSFCSSQNFKSEESEDAEAMGTKRTRTFSDLLLAEDFWNDERIDDQAFTYFIDSISDK
jgi:hypothetical protein